MLLDAGTLDMQNGWFVSGGFNEAAGATAEVDAGVFSASTGTIAGTVTGAGALYLEGGNDFTLAASAVINTGTLELGVSADGAGSNTTLASNRSYGGTLQLDNVSGNDATLALGGHGFTVTNAATLDGAIAGPGSFTVAQGARAVVAEPVGYSFLSVTGGARFVVAGAVTQYQSFTSNGLVSIAATGSWDFASDAGMGASGTGRVVNAGLIEKTAGTGASVIQGALVNQGTVLADSGTITAAGSVTSTGLIAGAGAFVDDGRFSSTGSIDVGALTLAGGGTLGGAHPIDVTGALTLQGNSDTLGVGATLNVGTLVLNAARLAISANETVAGQVVMNAGTFALGGHALTLTGPASLSGLVSGPGAIAIANGTLAGLTLSGAATMIDTGVIVQDGSVALGGGATDHGTLRIAAGATYDITAPAWLGNPNVNTTGTQTITNAGTLEMTASGTSSIFHSNITSSGRILTNGTLVLSSGSAALGGRLSGTGDLVLADAWTLTAPSANVTVGTLENQGAGTLGTALTYAGDFLNDAGSTLALNGLALTLNGTATLSGTIGNATGGPATLALADATLTGFAATGAIAVTDTGLVTQTGSVDLGGGPADTVAMAVQAGATYDILGPQWLGNPNANVTGTATITNAGLFEMTGSGTATVWHSVLTSTGTLGAAGTLSLNGGSAALSGALTGAGDIQLVENWTLAGGSTVSVGTLENAGAGRLLGNVTDQGAFVNDGGATLALGGHLLTLATGGTLGGTIDGAGTLRNPSGTLTLAGFTLGGGATLATSRLANQTGGVTLGDNNGAGTLTVTHGRL